MLICRNAEGYMVRETLGIPGVEPFQLADP